VNTRKHWRTGHWSIKHHCLQTTKTDVCRLSILQQSYAPRKTQYTISVPTPLPLPQVNINHSQCTWQFPTPIEAYKLQGSKQSFYFTVPLWLSTLSLSNKISLHGSPQKNSWHGYDHTTFIQRTHWNLKWHTTCNQTRWKMDLLSRHWPPFLWVKKALDTGSQHSMSIIRTKLDAVWKQCAHMFSQHWHISH